MAQAVFRGPPDVRDYSGPRSFPTGHRRGEPHDTFGAFRGSRRKSKVRQKRAWRAVRQTLGRGYCAGKQRSVVGGPFSYAGSGELLAKGKKVVANPAYHLGVQHADKLRAVGGLKRDSANADKAVHTPINPPSRAHLPQPFKFFRFSGNRAL